MTYGTVEQWHPGLGAINRPASIFDLSWQGGQQRLIVTVWYKDDEGDESAVLIFEDVFAFKVFDEDMELSGVTDDDAVIPKAGFFWGGRWPFLEVYSSEWIKRLTERHGGWKASEFRHLVITTENMHLHVACRKLSPVTYHFAV